MAERELRQHATRQAQGEALRLVRVAAREHEEVISNARQFLRLLAALPEVRTRQGSACGAILKELAPGDDQYTGFGAALPSGDVFCTGRPIPAPLNVADRLYFRRAMERRDFAVGEYQTGRASGKPVLVFGYPVLDVAGQVRGVVFTAVDLTWLNRLAAEAGLPRGSTLSLLDHKGVVLSRFPDPERWVGTARPAGDLLLKAIQGPQAEGAVEATGLDGTPRLYAYARPRGARGTDRVTLTAGIPRGVAFAEALAAQAVIAIGNARQYCQAADRATRLSIVNEVARAVAFRLESRDLFPAIIEQVRRATPCVRASLAVPEPDGRTCPHVITYSTKHPTAVGPVGERRFEPTGRAGPGQAKLHPFGGPPTGPGGDLLHRARAHPGR